MFEFIRNYNGLYKMLVVVAIFLVFVQALPTTLTDQAGSTQHIIIPEQFHIDFKCKGHSEEFCQAMARAVEMGAYRVSQEFEFQQTVTVVCYAAPMSNTAASTPTAWVPVRHKDDNQTYLYPTALLKQLGYSGVDEMKWPSHDIRLNINTQVKWWFADNPEARSIQDDEYDLEAVIVHELLHGLGFGASRIYRKSQVYNLVMPCWRFRNHSTLETAVNEIDTGRGPIGFSYPSIWDRFILLNNQRTTMLRNNMDAAFKRSLTCPDKFLLPVSPFCYCVQQMCEEMCMLATVGESLRFNGTEWPPNTPINTTVVLETSLRPFQPGSSTSHVALSEDASEFMMYYTCPPGWSLDDRIRATRALPSGLGPKTRDVMLALGYRPRQGTFVNRSHAAFVEPSVLGQEFPDDEEPSIKDANLSQALAHYLETQSSSQLGLGTNPQLVSKLSEVPPDMLAKPLANMRDYLLHPARNLASADLAQLAIMSQVKPM